MRRDTHRPDWRTPFSAHLMRGVRVEHQVNGASYVATIPDSFQLCAPISEFPSCEPMSE